MRKNKNNALTTEQKVMKGYKAYCGAVIGTALIMATAVPVFAAPATDPLTVVNNLSQFIFGLIRAIGMILLGLGIMLAANEVPRIAQQFGLDSSVRVNMSSIVHTTSTAVSIGRAVARAK